MNTSMERARVGLVSARTRHGLTETKLRELLPGERAYKVSDGGNGLYVVVSPSGSRSFRYDYRLSGRRETLTTLTIAEQFARGGGQLGIGGAVLGVLGGLFIAKLGSQIETSGELLLFVGVR